MLRSFTCNFMAVLLAGFFLNVANAEEEFTPLFDGKSLEGWQGSTDGYEVIDGAITCKPKGGGFLYTDKEYSNFVLKLKFKLTPGANNGLGIRTPKATDPAYSGMELQVLDNTADQYKNLKPYQYHGSIYGVVAAKRGYLKPVGEWNEQVVTVDGTKVKVVLNGEVIVDADIAEASKDGTVDGRNHPGLKRESGFICFCGHGSEVAFKDVEIQELK